MGTIRHVTANEIQRSEIDGVPVFWTPDAPRRMVSLLFRVGRADETVAAGGLTHMVEHLALFGLGRRQAYEYNGFVRGLRTTFFARGEPDELVAFVNHVCGALGDLPLDRLAAEGRVLRTEASGRGQSLEDLLLWLRYGSTGPGLQAIREWALAAPSADQVAGWARERFSRGNLVAWVSGPLPPGLRFALPEGSRCVAPEPSPIPFETPAWTADAEQRVSVSFVANRHDWLSATLQIVARRLTETLRYERGLIYDLGISYEPIATRLAHAFVSATALPAHAGDVERALVETLWDVRLHGATQDELDQAVTEFRRGREDPEHVFGDLDASAFNDLVGFDPHDPERLERELRERTPESTAAVMERALQTAVLTLPQGGRPSREVFTPYPSSSDWVAEGRRHRHRSDRYPWSRKGPTLIVGDRAATVFHPRGGRSSVAYDRSTLVVMDDGAIELIGDDGFAITVRPAEWADGPAVVRRIVDSFPPQRMVRIPVA